MESTAVPAGFFARGYQLLIAVASRLQSPLLLAIRLYWGWQFFGTGSGKLRHLDKTTEYFAQLHIPFPHLNASVAGATECFGGLLLLIGLGSRLVALPLIFCLTVADLTAEIDSVKHIFSDPDKFVTATPFLFLLACVIILVFGPGVFSVDGLIAKKFNRKA